MSSFNGKVAAVTGAGSGIGRALAVGLAKRGASLAISDVNEAALAETANLAKSAGAEVHTATVDVSDRQAVQQWALDVAERFGTVHQVYNNAGIASSSAQVMETDYAAYDRVIGINLWGVIHGTKEFLPHLIASGDGHVVNVSSLNGFMAQSRQSAYSASKFAVRGFTESLRVEMLSFGHPVAVTSVHPGGIQTNIVKNTYRAPDTDPAEVARQLAEGESYAKAQFKTTADEAAKKILHGVERKKGRVLIAQATWVDLTVRAIPATYPRLVARWEQQRRAKAAE